MIHTDGKQTIANRPVVRKRTASDRIREARALREHALDVAAIRALPTFNRGPQANGIEWNDDVCICGGIIADSPAGDKCWDCFNHEPGE